MPPAAFASDWASSRWISSTISFVSPTSPSSTTTATPSRLGFSMVDFRPSLSVYHRALALRSATESAKNAPVVLGDGVSAAAADVAKSRKRQVAFIVAPYEGVGRAHTQVGRSLRHWGPFIKVLATIWGPGIGFVLQNWRRGTDRRGLPSSRTAQAIELQHGS